MRAARGGRKNYFPWYVCVWGDVVVALNVKFFLFGRVVESWFEEGCWPANKWLMLILLFARGVSL